MSPIPRIRRVALSGVDTAYRTIGHGEPLLLLHAGIADSRMWWPQYAALARTHTIVAPDLPGYGYSAIPDRPFSYHEHVFLLLSHLGIHKAWMVGVSFGGRIVLESVIAKPERAMGIVIVSPLLDEHAGSQVIREFSDEESRLLEAGDLASASHLNMKMWLSGPRRPLSAIKGPVRRRLYGMQINAFRHQRGKEAQVVEPEGSISDGLTGLALPSLVMYGRMDHRCVEQSARVIGSRLTGATLHSIEGAAHLPSVERPEVFNDLVLRLTSGNRVG